MNKFLPVVGVMGSGKMPWNEWAEPLGRLLSSKPVHLLTGGGAGTMTSVSKAFCESKTRKGLCLGVVPSDKINDGYQVKQGYPNAYVELAIQSPLGIFGGEDPHHVSRNQINIMTSHAVVALPGTQGTMNEVNITLWLNKPLILFGPDEAFSGFSDKPERTTDIKRIECFLEETLRFSKEKVAG